MMKIIALVYRKPGTRSEQFLSYWLSTHGPLMLRLTPGLLHYTQNVPVQPTGSDDDADGISELWFDDMDALQDYLEWRDSPEAAELRQDEERFQDTRRTRRYIVEEHVFKLPGPRGALPG